MKKVLLILIFLILIQQSSAWDWNNHKAMVQTLYYATPYEVQRNLDLQQLEIGSIAPDKDFHDNRLHHYPKSYNLTIHWIEEAEKYLKNKKYKKTI